MPAGPVSAPGGAGTDLVVLHCGVDSGCQDGSEELIKSMAAILWCRSLLIKPAIADRLSRHSPKARKSCEDVTVEDAYSCSI